jgi:hypothetical protein
MPLPLSETGGRPAGAEESITIVNRGAYVYWTSDFGSFQSRSNIVINGPVSKLYLPIVIR